MRVRIKICGITRIEDALAAVRAGADALGFNFFPPSPRAVSLADAAAITRALPAFVTKVGVFVDPTPAELDAALAEVDLDLLQFQGEETEALCAAAGRPYVKAFRMQGEFDVAHAETVFAGASAWLLDSHVPGLHGGTGVGFDWRYWPERAPKPLILAGGLTVQNVAAAIEVTMPYAVDVAGGVEGAVKGHKDAAKIEAFVAEVMRVSR